MINNTTLVIVAIVAAIGLLALVYVVAINVQDQAQAAECNILAVNIPLGPVLHLMQGRCFRG
jgi:hypothetical protein